MSLHPGEHGVCNKHGEYDEFCSKCTDEKRGGQDRRAATDQQSKPIGDGYVVLDYVDARLANMLELSRLRAALGPKTKADDLVALREDLFERSVVGTAKYGTPLRIRNGRNPEVDLYQELCDAIMYSAQCRLEYNNDGGNYVELLIEIASQIAGRLRRSGQSNPTAVAKAK